MDKNKEDGGEYLLARRGAEIHGKNKPTRMDLRGGGGVVLFFFGRQEIEGKEKHVGHGLGTFVFYRMCGAPDAGATHEGVAPPVREPHKRVSFRIFFKKGLFLAEVSPKG